VHGITSKFLKDKPHFAQIASDFLEFIKGAELIIHNAPFDVGFLNHEFGMLDDSPGSVADYCSVVDTLTMARRLHPGQRNSLDALCKRYEIDNSHRELHGALLDAEILSDVYLLMTGGQVSLSLDGHADAQGNVQTEIRRLSTDRQALKVIKAGKAELKAHAARLDTIEKSSGATSVWRELEQEA
jgi:DNA polymerase-3 subunit epsilon